MNLKQFKTPALISFLTFGIGIFAGLIKSDFYSSLIIIGTAIFLIIARIFPYWILVVLGFMYARADSARLQDSSLNKLIDRKVIVFGKIVDNRFVVSDSITSMNRVLYKKTKLFISSRISIGCGKVKMVGLIHRPKGSFNTYLISNQASGIIYPISYKIYSDWICSIRNHIRKIIRDNSWSGVNFEIFRALLLGERLGVPEDVLGTFKRTGTMHILALSGLHVGIIALVIFSIVLMFRSGEEVSLILTAVALTFYLVLVGFKSSLFRAYLFFVSLIIARLAGRKIKYLNVWGFAGLISLMYNPLWLLNPGFQFSYLATLGIILSLKFKIGGVSGYILKLFLTSLAATMFVSPLQIYYFKMFTPVSIFANILVIPLVFVILSEIITGLLFTVVHLGFIGRLFFNVGNLALNILLWALKIISRLPGAFIYDKSPINVFQAAILIAFFTVLFVGINRMVSEIQKPG